MGKDVSYFPLESYLLVIKDILKVLLCFEQSHALQSVGALPSVLEVNTEVRPLGLGACTLQEVNLYFINSRTRQSHSWRGCPAHGHSASCQLFFLFPFLL